MVALTTGNGEGNGPHQGLAQHKSSPHHMDSLSTGIMVPHHHHEHTNCGSLVGWGGLFLAKLRLKATRHANIISQLLLVI